MGATLIGTYLYAPESFGGVLRPWLQVLVIPLLALTGVGLWQQVRLQRLARRVVYRWGRSELIVVAILTVGAVHHVDHILRFENSGWPFRPEVTPFTASLVAYPLLVTVLLLKRSPIARLILLTAGYLATQISHVVSETPAVQYGSWAHGRSPDGHVNLLGLSSHIAGVASTSLSIALSIAFLAAIGSVYGDVVSARSARQERP